MLPRTYSGSVILDAGTIAMPFSPKTRAQMPSQRTKRQASRGIKAIASQLFNRRLALKNDVDRSLHMSLGLRARAEINSHFAGPQARWRGASGELYPGRYVRSEQQRQRARGPQPAGARRRRARIGFVAAPRRCPTSTSSRRLASARPALAPKWEFTPARALGLSRSVRLPGSLSGWEL